jgi:hypothetical protein
MLARGVAALAALPARRLRLLLLLPARRLLRLLGAVGAAVRLT